MIIVSYHISYVFNTGWIFVEFFFMLSLPIYCIHPVVRYYFGADDKVKYYLITIAAAAVMAAVVEGIAWALKKRTA